MLQFLWTGTHLGGKWNQRATRARQVRLALQVRPHLPRATSPVPNTSFPACTTWMNEIDQGNAGMIEWMKL
jgi:hypothetical protein